MSHGPGAAQRPANLEHHQDLRLTWLASGDTSVSRGERYVGMDEASSSYEDTSRGGSRVAPRRDIRRSGSKPRKEGHLDAPAPA